VFFKARKTLHYSPEFAENTEK